MNKNCGAFIYCTKTKRYLFLLRNKGKFAGTWGIVGGGIEGNESVKDCLEREILEEMGGKITGAKYIALENFVSTNGKFTYQTFLVKVEEEFIPELNNEHIGFCWAPLKNTPIPLHPGVFRTLRHSKIKEKLEAQENL